MMISVFAFKSFCFDLYITRLSGLKVNIFQLPRYGAELLAKMTFS